LEPFDDGDDSSLDLDDAEEDINDVGRLDDLEPSGASSSGGLPPPPDPQTMDGILHRIGEIIRFRRVMQPVRAATLMAIVDGSVAPDAPCQECSPALVSALGTPTSQR
jgi:hypothetical protein